MTEAEIKRLLAAAMAYDNRKPGQAAVLAWQEAARRREWTFEEALDAIHEHYASSTAFLMPAHVTEGIDASRRQRRRQKLEEIGEHRRAELEPAAAPPQPERVRAIVDSVADRLGWQRKPKPHQQALLVDCPHCQAVAGRPCARQITRGHRRGEYLALDTPHPSRRDAAEKASA